MTPSLLGPHAIREIQRTLADAGYGVRVDGIWGPQTASAYAHWTQTPAIGASAEVTDALPKPDWKSKTVIGVVVALLAKGAERLWPEVQVDTAATVEAILELVQIGALLFAWYGRRVARAPIALRRRPAVPGVAPAPAVPERVRPPVVAMPTHPGRPAARPGGAAPGADTDAFWSDGSGGPFLE